MGDKRGYGAGAEDYRAAPVEPEHYPADHRINDGTDATDAERPANAGGADVSRIENCSKGVGAILPRNNSDSSGSGRKQNERKAASGRADCGDADRGERSLILSMMPMPDRAAESDIFIRGRISA